MGRKTQQHTCIYDYDTYSICGDGASGIPYGYQSCGPRRYGAYRSGVVTFYTTAKTPAGLRRAADAAAWQASYRDYTGYMARLVSIDGRPA